MRDRSATHRRILDAAYTLFFRNGFARINVDQIAEQASVTKRTLYDHFRSKDELLAAVLEFQHDLALARIEKLFARSARTLPEMMDHMSSGRARQTDSSCSAGAKREVHPSNRRRARVSALT